MRAAVMQGLHKPLIIETLPDPDPSPGELVVRVGRCGICGSDLHMTGDASYGRSAGDILGHEFAGEVVALGQTWRVFARAIWSRSARSRAAATVPHARPGRSPGARPSRCRAAAMPNMPSPAPTSA